jgi:diketogulonate reductase-like aldo/keto reductase
MHDEGLVAAIGVSNFHPNQLIELLSFVANKRVAVVQNFMVSCEIFFTDYVRIH